MQRSTSLQHAPCLDAKHSSFHHKVGECFEQNTSTVDKYHLPKNNTSYTLGPLTLNAMSHALPLSISWIKANRSTTFRSMFELGRLDQIVPYVQALIHHYFENYEPLALSISIITLPSHCKNFALVMHTIQRGKHTRESTGRIYFQLFFIIYMGRLP